MRACSVNDNYLFTAPIDQTNDLTVGHTDQE